MQESWTIITQIYGVRIVHAAGDFKNTPDDDGMIAPVMHGVARAGKARKTAGQGRRSGERERYLADVDGSDDTPGAATSLLRLTGIMVTVRVADFGGSFSYRRHRSGRELSLVVASGARWAASFL